MIPLNNLGNQLRHCNYVLSSDSVNDGCEWRRLPAPQPHAASAGDLEVSALTPQPPLCHWRS